MSMEEGNRTHEHVWLRERDSTTEVCTICGDHRGTVRCWCGWSLSGENAYRMLEQLGERLEEEEE